MYFALGGVSIIESTASTNAMQSTVSRFMNFRIFVIFITTKTILYHKFPYISIFFSKHLDNPRAFCYNYRERKAGDIFAI